MNRRLGTPAAVCRQTGSHPANHPALSLPSALLLALTSGPVMAQSPPAAGDPPFVNVTAQSNIAYKVGYTAPSLSGRYAWQLSTVTNGGAAAGDCDNDSDIDLFITYGNTSGPDGGGGPNRLYLNQLIEQGNGLLFEDVAAAAGVANSRTDGKGNDRHSGPTFADMDGDGDLDLFVGGIFNDPSKIYANQGDCTFIDVTANSPQIESMAAAHTVSAAFGDYDLDGDLDLFLTHWGTLDDIYGYPRERETDHLWRNESDASGIRYVNVSGVSGISDVTFLTRRKAFCGETECGGDGVVQVADFTLTPTFARINRDLWPDIAIAGDYGTTQLAINLGNGTFGSLDNSVLLDAQYGMGSSLGDVDNDGDLDWFVTSIFGPAMSIAGPGSDISTPRGNRLYRNDGGAELLADATEQYGVADGSFAWASCLLDIDNDTDLDIFHTNGYAETIDTENSEVYETLVSRAFVLGSDGAYTDEVEGLGLASHTSGRGVVCADFDNDGDIDILEMTDSGPNSALLWENRSAAAGNHFLRIRLQGLPPNTEAAGARVYVTVGERRQMREIMIGSNYTSQNPAVQVFGLGAAVAADEILIEWPPLDGADGPGQIGTLLQGPIAAGAPGQTIVISHPALTTGP